VDHCLNRLKDLLIEHFIHQRMGTRGTRVEDQIVRDRFDAELLDESAMPTFEHFRDFR
jgi:hypothetical protein